MECNVRRELGMKQKAKDKIRRVWVINPKTRVIPNKKSSSRSIAAESLEIPGSKNSLGFHF